MLDSILLFAKYNIWANNKVIEWIQGINENQWKLPLVSSFNSIEATCIHVLSAENIWHQRLRNEPTFWLADNYTQPKELVLRDWQAASTKLLTYVQSIKEEDLNKDFRYMRINGEYNEMPLFHVLMHLFNHSTQHRGQLITLLRQVGFTTLNPIDLLYFKNDV